MRAGRLVSLVLLLQRKGRVTSRELAAELEVSERTVLRDLEELSAAGIPVYATRGPGGGFQLLDGYTHDLPNPEEWKPRVQRPGLTQRAVVRISPEGRHLVAVLGRLPPIRVRRTTPADEDGWVEATFRLDSLEATVVELLSLSGHVEVLGPPRLRSEVSTRVQRAAARYRDPS